MANGGEFPIQHGHHFVIGGMEHQVVQAVVTMHDADLGRIQSTCRHIGRQPLHQVVHFWNGLRFRSHILLTPTSNLAFEVIAGFAVICQSAFFVSDCVQR